MSVTLKQIADEVGVSQPLVTYALNNKPGVSEEKRRRILEAAERLGYERGANREAQVLISKRFGKRLPTGVIALVYSRTEDTPLLSTPFYRGLLEGVEHETERRELELLITPMRDGTLPRLAREGKVDGLIFASIPLHAEDEAHELQLPAVTLSTHANSFFNLLPDDEGGMYQATNYLLDQGHQRIGYISMSRPPARASRHVQAEARLAGYRRAMLERGIEVESGYSYIAKNSLEQDGAEGLDELLSRFASKSGFSALVCHNDVMAMGVVRRAQELGIRIPRDLSVVGFDDISEMYNFRPHLTSVGFSRFEMGKRAVELVCEQFAAMNTDGKAAVRAPAGRETFPTNLVLRESTAKWSRD